MIIYSIIVPSYNRIDELKELLPCFRALDFNRNHFEIIIVDDGSTDGSYEYCTQFKSEFADKLVLLKQENKGPGSARNYACSVARGSFLIFIDSDVLLPDHWLKAIDDGLHVNQADAFGGPDKAHESFSPFLKAVDYAMTSFISTGGLRGKSGKKLAKYYPRSFNMGLKKELLNRIGLFGSLRHGQDIEFSHRIIKSNASIAFIENAYVYHKRRTSIKRFFKQVFNWGVARINLYLIDSSMLEPLHILPALASSLFILMMLSSFLSDINLITSQIVLGIMGLVFVFSMLDAWRKYHVFKTVLWVPLTLFIQIFAYGMGFIYAFYKRILLKDKELKGFTKHYYK